MNATTVYAGLDIHATNTVIQLINEQGSPIAVREVPTRADRLISWARGYPRSRLHIILEQGIHARCECAGSVGCPVNYLWRRLLESSD